MYEHEWTVRFADTDPFQIAHYPDIVVAIHDVADRFMESIGFPFWELTGEHGYGLPIVEFHVEFEQPVRAGETVTVQLTPDLGDRSVRFDYTAVAADGSVAFTAYEQRACVPVDGDRATALPDDLREAMAPYAES
ncbi:MAG: acyl-CoA thioesterase [Halobacteriales archaeon]|nr:acyl-CoA thioesterase [Halobacteriales archaeon]